MYTPIEAKADLIAFYQKRLKEGMSHQNAFYAAMFHTLDENIVLLMKKLAALDLSNKTVVVFTSDNDGFINDWEEQSVTSNTPLPSGKGALYEGSIRVPTLIRWPGVSIPGTRSDYPITTQDFYPTLLEMADLKADPVQLKELDGISMVPVLKSPKAKMKQRNLYLHFFPHYFATTGPVSAIRHENWKLLEFHEDDQVELYDLETDQGEMKSLAKVNQIKAEAIPILLQGWRQNINASMPIPNPNFGKH
ncbi:MAG: arylsulfatase A [Saprospiraceae bacterium]